MSDEIKIPDHVRADFQTALLLETQEKAAQGLLRWMREECAKAAEAVDCDCCNFKGGYESRVVAGTIRKVGTK